MERSTRLEDWPDLARAVTRELDTWPAPARARVVSLTWRGPDDAVVTIAVDPRGEYDLYFGYGTDADDPTSPAKWTWMGGGGGD